MRTAAGANATATQTGKPVDELLPRVFALLFGLLLGVSLLKFGNPVVMEKFVEQPTNFYEWLFNNWPAVYGYGLLAAVGGLGLFTMRLRKDLPWLLVVLPLIWLLWQFVAATQTIDVALTRGTLRHFTACVACFYLGLLALSRSKNLELFSLGLLAGFSLVLVAGFQQRFGGLEETRRYFYLYVYPLHQFPPGYLKKIATNRIFGTLFYANTLAGVILMLLPLTLAMVWSQRERLTVGARSFLMGAAGLAALACLFWSGSKGGWLLMLVIGFIGALFLRFPRRLKITMVAGVLILGLAGFAWKNSGYFKRGATSVVARFDYWQAAVQTCKEKPMFGSGPGTFGLAYEKIKKPESEMARMTHNDYLEQASDSGLIGFLSFTGFVAAGLIFTYRKSGLKQNGMKLAVWLGLLGWALQSLVEFGLYIPAMAWPAFCLLGWLLGQTSNQIDSRQRMG